MRPPVPVVLLVTSLLLAGPATALAPDELRQMREQVRALADRVEAQQRQIDAQEEALQAAGVSERGGAWGLAPFLAKTDFRGWVAASYFWNVNNPRKPNSGGNGPFSNPFHADHNSFQFDEAWFVMDRPASEESPGGFHVEVVFGATASAFSNISNGSPRSGNLNGNDLWIPSANVSYRTPWGPTLLAGKFVTRLGYEVAGAPNNVNITRGFTYNLFQPVSHTGILVSQQLDGGFGYAVGVVNGFDPEQPNVDNSLAALAHVGFTSDVLSLQLGGIYADARNGESGDLWLVDAVAEIAPTDDVLFWLNFDYINQNQDGENPWGVGVSAGGRVGVTDSVGVGGRVEYAHFDDEDVATFTDGSGALRPRDGDLWSLTGTLDVALTENLVGKLEAKYELGHNGLGDSYREDKSGTSGDAVFVGSQLYYSF